MGQGGQGVLAVLTVSQAAMEAASRLHSLERAEKPRNL